MPAFFDVENNPESYNLFEKIIQACSYENFIEEVAIKALIRLKSLTADCDKKLLEMQYHEIYSFLKMTLRKRSY